MVFAREFDLRWSDADPNGHVRHTVYAELAAEGRLAWFAEGGFGWTRLEQLGIGPVLLREEVDYRSELGVGERVRVEVDAAGLSPDGGRWRLLHRILRLPGADLAATIVVLGGWIDLARRRLVPAPEPLAAFLRAATRGPEFEELPPLRARE